MTQPEESKLKEIDNSVAILRRGGVIIFPTDTVYGIGCRWDNTIAIKRIENIKRSHQNFPILISKPQELYRLASVTPLAHQLIAKYWPGGLTLVLERRDNRQKIAVRQPDSDQIRQIIEKLGVPIIGTSANFHGQKSPTSYDELDPRIVKMVDYVMKGKCKYKQESTVIDTTVSPTQILRRGAVKIN